MSFQFSIVAVKNVFLIKLKLLHQLLPLCQYQFKKLKLLQHLKKRQFKKLGLLLKKK